VPVLAPSDGEPLAESMMILEHLDDLVGPERALMPPSGPARREALRILAFATGAVEKAIQITGERIFRPEEKYHAPYVERCRTQLRGALGELDKICMRADEREWLIGDASGNGEFGDSRMTQADITLACYVTYAHEGALEPLDPFPALRARHARYEALPVFRRYYAAFEPPVASTQQSASA
jgi:glutathione S-transferase